MTKVWDTECESHTQKLVLLALADNANDQGVCWPSIPTIAKKCSLTDRAVYAQIEALQSRNLVGVDSGGGVKNNTYHIFPAKEKIVITPERRSPPPLNTVQGSPERRSPPPLNTVQGSNITVIETTIKPDVEFDFPPGFPLDEAMAKASAAVAGVDPEFAVDVWRKAMGRGCRDAKDVLIRGWSYYLKTEANYAKNRQHQTPIINRNIGTMNENNTSNYDKLVSRVPKSK